jgi:putative transposase
MATHSPTATGPPERLTAITDKVIPAMREWQNRPLESLYGLVWLDGIYYKVRHEGKVITRVLYSVIGLTLSGKKQVLGIYTAESESAKFWLSVLTDLKQRGVDDLLITCVDGLKGFDTAIFNVFPAATVQLCIVHQLRNSFRFVPDKLLKDFARDLKTVYQAPNREQAGRPVAHGESVVGSGKMGFNLPQSGATLARKVGTALTLL